MAALAVLWLPIFASGLSVEVPLKRHTVVVSGVASEGLFATLEVGTPPQRILVRIDTASQATYIPGFGDGKFVSENSTSASVGESAHVPFYGGLTVIGDEVQDTVVLGDATVTAAPLLVARNFSGTHQPERSRSRPALVPHGALPLDRVLVHETDAGDRKATPATPRGVGLMGLVCMTSSLPLSIGVPGINEAYHPSKHRPGSFLEAFWESHPMVHKQYRLELGGSRPRLVIGDETREGPPEQGGVRFLANWFTAQSPMWYVSLRALGLSQGEASPVLHWSTDYNSVLPSGAPALLNSGAPGIHVGSAIYAALVSVLPSGCERDRSSGATTCACNRDTWQADFPSFSLSFESADTVRILGLDSGADLRVCVPAAAYVRYDNVSKRCAVAIVDSGPRHALYGYEQVILGEPFFRSVALVLDLERRRVGVGAPLQSPIARSAGGDVEVSRGGEWQQPAPAAPGAEDHCPCADPKNWWSTGKRFSPRRVVVCLIIVSLVAAYTFFGFSPSPMAETVRQHAEFFCPGANDFGPAPQGRPQHGFAEMSTHGRMGGGPE